MTTNRLIAIPALMTVLLAADPVPAREVYRWVDEEGVIHYTQHPPANRSWDRLDATPRPADDPRESRAETEELLESASERAYRERLEREEAERLRQSRAERAAWCPQARRQLQALRNRGRVRQEEEGYRLMTDEERQAEARALQEKIERRCTDL